MKERFLTVIYITLIVMSCITIQSQTIVTSYFENFNNPVDLNLWSPDTTSHEDGSPVFDVSQIGGVLHVNYNQKDYTSGQGYNFTKNKNIVFNLSANPYVSFDMKIEQGATYDNIVVDSVLLEVSPFAPHSVTGEMSQQVYSVIKMLPADGLWHSYTFDIRPTIPEYFGQEILEDDLTKIQMIMLDPSPWPYKYQYSYDIDNFRIGSFTTISGNVFYDLNQNKTQDENEYGIPNIEITSDIFNLYTNNLGEFHTRKDNGDLYQIKIKDNPHWALTTDSSSYSGVFIPEDSTNNQKTFGLFPTSTDHNLTGYLMSNPTRCNTEVNFFIKVQNNGTYIENGEFLINYDEMTSFVDASPYPDQIDTISHILTWNIDSIYPYETQDIILNLLMPDENTTGNPLHFHQSIYRDSLEALVLDDEINYESIVQCSFDSIYKTVIPGGVQKENYTIRDELLQYTIRFQNTKGGFNTTAFNLTILDTLDVNFDLNSFNVVQSSFPVQTTLDENKVQFFFKNIQLPYSGYNEPESHGFVTYEIKMKEDAPDYTIIENTAHIIFDFNPPIVTNTTKSTLVKEIPVFWTFLAEGNQWIYNFTEVTIPFIYNQTIETITVIGDTIVNDETYAILYSTKPMPCHIHETYEYLREEGDKIYRLNKAKDQEFLMIDFGETESYTLYFETGLMGNLIDTAIVMIDSFGTEILPDGNIVDVQYAHIINNQSYDDETVYKVYKNIGFAQYGLLFPDLGTGLCDPLPGTDIQLKCHISDETLHFTTQECDELIIICANIIPKEQNICVEDVTLDSTTLIDFAIITSGTSPYTYIWSCEYISELGNTYTASDFLQDTTILKPIISNFIDFNVPITFHLTVIDATDQTCTNDIRVTFSAFEYTLGYGSQTINQGDSIQLVGSGVDGGISPLSYHVIPDFNVTDPTDPFTYVSPDTSTTYAIYVIDSAGCISNPNPILDVSVIPSSTSNIDGVSIQHTLFPNPVKDELYLSIETEYFQKGISLTIYDTNGRRIFTQSIHHKQSIIHSKDWISGMYYYELSIGKKIFATGKILK